MKKRLLIFVVAYFAESTIEKVLRRVPRELLDVLDVEILVIDDASNDKTFSVGVETSKSSEIPFKIKVLHNPMNQGYGGNQKIGYHYGIKNGFDLVALLHGDGQYAPEVLPALLDPLLKGEADAVFGSRMIKPWNAIRGGMPFYKFVGNRILTFVQNKVLGTSLSEFHSGYRVYSIPALKRIPFQRNANVFHFDTEIIIQLVLSGMKITEVPIPTYYGDEICRVNGLMYAAHVLKASMQARLQQVHLFYDRRFEVARVDAGVRYPSKLEFDSSHSQVLRLVANDSRVLDLGSGMGAVAEVLTDEKSCKVVGCDIESAPRGDCFQRFVLVDLNNGIPDFGHERFDVILALDIIEHLRSPEDFLDQLRTRAAQADAKVILTTANIGFALIRLSLLMGRFEYGKRGILDLTHTRLFTLRSLRRAMTAAGFDVEQVKGIVPPLPFVFGKSLFSRSLMAISQFFVWLWPALFGFQLLVVAKARPTLETLLDAAEASANDDFNAVDDAPSRRNALRRMAFRARNTN